MTTPDTKTLAERLRKPLAEFDLLCTTEAESLHSQAADRLEALQNKLDSLPADWLEDSSLETWFPITAEQFISQAQRIAELEESQENTLNLLEASQGRIRRQEIEAHELHSTNTSLKDKVRELISQRDHFQSEATRLRGMCIDKANGMAELQSQLDEYREDPKNL